MAEERVEVWLNLKNIKALDGLHVDNGCMPFRKRDDGSIEMIAVVTTSMLGKLKKKRGVSVEVLGDTKVEAGKAASQVSRTNRYADGSLPASLGLLETRHVD